MVDKARVCLVYEEAHSLIPEWNAVATEGDRTATNGTARAIQQGRKYGLGCLVVTQRTASVTKTILNQCNTVFAMRTLDETAKDFLANYVGREYADALSSLTERQAVFFGKASSCENPVLIRLNDRDSFLRTFRKKYPPPKFPEVHKEIADKTPVAEQSDAIEPF
jgi:DNA helicase HerA-like ATPase